MTEKQTMLYGSHTRASLTVTPGISSMVCFATSLVSRPTSKPLVEIDMLLTKISTVAISSSDFFRVVTMVTPFHSASSFAYANGYTNPPNNTPMAPAESSRRLSKSNIFVQDVAMVPVLLPSLAFVPGTLFSEARLSDTALHLLLLPSSCLFRS